jgi:hypothetical protein
MHFVSFFFVLRLLCAPQILYRDGTANAAFVPRMSARTVNHLQSFLLPESTEAIALDDRP